MSVSITQIAEELFEIVLMRVWVSIQAEQVNCDVVTVSVDTMSIGRSIVQLSILVKG